MPETQYKPIPYLFSSKGLAARQATDRLPQGFYLNLKGCYERAEDSMGSRYGSQIINRDPDNTGEGTNWFLPNPVQTITRLKYNSATYRYAGSGESLYRRVGDTPGPYTSIYTGLSGQPFGSASTNCFGSSLNYLFIADQNAMLKDSGTGLPTQWGITTPNQTANATEMGPTLLLIDGFTAPVGDYTLNNVTSWASTPIGNVNVTSESAWNNFAQFGSDASLLLAFNGALATPSDEAGNLTQSLIFNIYDTPNPPQFSSIGVDASIPSAATSFALNSYSGDVAPNTTASVGRTVNLDLSQNYQVTDDDLISICLQLSDPSAIQQINLMFDVNNSGYKSSYYTKSISPAYYQSGIAGDTDAYTTASNEILALSLGLLTGSTTGQQQANSIIQQLQSATANTGQSAWSTIWSRRGDFLAVGNAGEPGYDWSSITGWQVQIVTTTSASVEFALNGLYLQWGAGPSSFGGVGYDYRYIYYNANTQTPSNPSGIQYFDQQYGFVASYMAPIVLRQGINVSGVYSSDPQVTHVQIFRRGGSLADNWYYLDQFPNVTGGGAFSYIDVIPDLAVAQGNILQLDNDPPVTSTLQNPITTYLSVATTGPGTSPYSQFVPQTVTTTGMDTFLPNQTVVVGSPYNLEETQVITGGVGTFTAILRLRHAVGEQVQAFSVPQQPCDLVGVAYGQTWVAGDPNNPHYLYYSKNSYPENFGPQRYIPVGTPQSPINAIITDYRGTLYVGTLTTWYQIVPGNPPYPQSTGSRHGIVSKQGWAQAEGSVWYEAIDGIREFRGADGPYRSLPIEWIFRDVPLTPVPLLDNSQISTVSMAFWRNTIFAAYTALDGTRNRLVWDTNYSRWRNDDVPALTMYLEEDTQSLLYSKFMTSGGQSGYAIVQGEVGDYDDGGWVNGALTEIPINMDCQLPYQDVGAPHYPKQWNVFEVDANTNGQTMTLTLNFDDGIAPLTLGTFSTTERQKVQFNVKGGKGVESYKCSPEITAAVIVAPYIYQLNAYADTLAANRTSLDVYWWKFGTEETKFVKEVYFDYTATTSVALSFYVDGRSTAYYTTTLPARAERAIIRVRLPALMFRTWRLIALSDEPMQNWSAPRAKWKPVNQGANAYAAAELPT
jgi:hypothetical protein